ncbi:N-acetylglucosamine-6-phosphate deacetylase [Brevibacillus sp. H7]|uniref:N-acetylglucosamine-6-phosphate deacetylase n=1 Tax=Brevibacillus sp. H7 TaxID=3349138 RepID=UPI003808405B
MRQAFALRGPMVVPGSAVVENGLVVVEGTAIVFAGAEQEYAGVLPDQVTSVQNGWICPGFIDMHMHGIGGHDTMDGTEESLQAISGALVRFGVTSFLATTMTAPLDRLAEVVENVSAVSRLGTKGASIAGIHLEGPWINPRYKGAQNEEHIVSPELEQAKRLYELSDGLIKVVTIAPEQPGALETIRFFKEQGVIVSAGHTGATFAQAKQAVDCGVEHFTHCFNAMTGMHHREPGVAGAAMYFERLSTELIADGEHVHPAVMSILYRVKKASRLALVSDSMRATGLEQGVYELGGQPVHVDGGRAALADGTLAGSILTLNRAVRNMVVLCGVTLPDAVAMASQTPAKILGLSDRKGRLAAGYDADITILAESFEVAACYVNGRLAYERKEGSN